MFMDGRRQLVPVVFFNEISYVSSCLEQIANAINHICNVSLKIQTQHVFIEFLPNDYYPVRDYLRIKFCGLPTPFL